MATEEMWEKMLTGGFPRLERMRRIWGSVEPGTNALDVFEHPYAHAAWRGVDYRLADLRDAA
jgi:hypothetical protein